MIIAQILIVTKKSSYNPEQKQVENIGDETTEPGCAIKVFEEKWTFIEAGTDCRPKFLPDFNEPSERTFIPPANPVSSSFYKKIFPDSLFNRIANCTNLRASRHFANLLTKSDKCWRELR